MSRILVADDAPALRVLLRRCLEVGGHEVVLATDGSEAIQLVRTPGAGFDAVVTDHAMPGASGLEVIEAAQQVDPRLPCIIVTAHDDLDLATSALAVGADAFVPKPFKPAHLLTIVQRALDRRRQADAEVLGTTAAHRPGDVAWAAALAGRIAVRLGLSAETVGHARVVAAMRTASRPSLPEVAARMLNRVDGATEQIDRNQARASATLLDGVPGLAPVQAALLHQREWWDGTGHPDGMSAGEIPVLAWPTTTHAG